MGSREKMSVSVCGVAQRFLVCGVHVQGDPALGVWVIGPGLQERADGAARPRHAALIALGLHRHVEIDHMSHSAKKRAVVIGGLHLPGVIPRSLKCRCCLMKVLRDA